MAPADLTVGGVNLANQVSSSMGVLKSVLPGITDAATAQAALPKIHEATAQLNEIAAVATNLSPERKSALAKLIAAAAPAIYQMCDKVVATPGVGDVARANDRRASPKDRNAVASPDFADVEPRAEARAAQRPRLNSCITYREMTNG